MQASQDIIADLVSMSDKVKAWMFDDAFAFWANHGVIENKGFFEILDAEGNGIPNRDSRVRVQARQTFSFALAAGLGWHTEKATELVKLGLKTLIKESQREDGLYGTRVRPGIGLTDSNALLYDNAFVLLAFATAFKYLKSTDALDAGTQLNILIEKRFKHTTANIGYVERLPFSSLRKQNPHAHLCEASLAWFEATGDVMALARSSNIEAFIETHFFDAHENLLFEYEISQLENHMENHIENHVEVGHMFEWVWILHRKSTLTKTLISPFAKKLYKGGMALLAQEPSAPLSQTSSGKVLDGKRRVWVLTEILKGHIAWANSFPTSSNDSEILNTVHSLFSLHLDDAVKGAWLDTIMPNDQPSSREICASTAYHVFLAFSEFIDCVDRNFIPPA